VWDRFYHKEVEFPNYPYEEPEAGPMVGGAAKKLQEVMQEGITKGVYPGAVLLVSTEKTIVFWEETGYACVDPQTIPMRKDTIFDVASLTKPLATSLAVMKLVEDRIVNLEGSLADLLPEDLPDDKRAITLRQLLAHSAGLRDWVPFFKEIGPENRESSKGHIRKLVLESPLEYRPGSGVLYSDLGYILLEWIVEAVSGLSLPEFLGKHFFTQLGLKRTFFQEVGDVLKFPIEEYAATERCPWRGRVMRGLVHDENAYAMGGISGHAGLFSNALEIFTLCFSLMECYQGEGTDLVGTSVVREFFKRQKGISGNTWALGWDTPSVKGSSAGRFFSRNSVGHLGFTGTSVWMDLEKRLIVVFLTNRIHPSRRNEKIRAFRPYLHDTVASIFG